MCNFRVLRLPDFSETKIQCETIRCPQLLRDINIFHKIKDILIEDKQITQGSTAVIKSGGRSYPSIEIEVCTPPQHGYSYEICINRHIESFDKKII